jgi:stress-induced-phosphoprotein 1
MSDIKKVNSIFHLKSNFNIKLAIQLKEEGNNHFKAKQYDLAIKSYSDALALTDVDSHLLFSNRSAAYTLQNLFVEASADARKCIELRPDWSKGYFRLGKAFFHDDKITEAFINFHKGLVHDPKSDELKSMKEAALQR